MSRLADYWRGVSRLERDARLWVAAWALASFSGFGVQAGAVPASAGVEARYKGESIGGRGGRYLPG